MRIVVLALVLVSACAAKPKRNEVVGKLGRASWRAPVASAVFCTKCGDHGVVQVELGTPPRVALEIPSCYPHAQSKIGDADKIKIELDHVAATAGQLDIADCTTQHLTATAWATFPDGTRIEASVDTELVRR
jgi:hypothetical protein